MDRWTRALLILFFSLSARFRQGLRQSTHRSQSLLCHQKTRPRPSFTARFAFAAPETDLFSFLSSGSVKTMQGTQETEKTTNTVLESTLVQDTTLVDLGTPQKMVGKLLPFIQLVPDQDNAEPSGHRLTPLFRSNIPSQPPTLLLAQEELRDHRRPAVPPFAGENTARKTTRTMNNDHSPRFRQPLSEPLTRERSTKRPTKRPTRIQHFSQSRFRGRSPPLWCPLRPP